MKKINKTPGPNALTRYAQHHPLDRWDPDFKNSNAGTEYQALREQMLADQGGLCGYCEVRVADLPAHKQRVEHFHSKSDSAAGGKNWGLDWDNIFAVCTGGSHADRAIHPLPRNLSCDSHKEHAIAKGCVPLACEGNVINPLEMLAFPRLFDFDRRTGKLLPNTDACSQAEFRGNRFDSTEELVENTIKVLNLNCDRLNKQRLEVLHTYNREIKKAKQTQDKKIFQTLSKRWFGNKWHSFFTTRRALLKDHAESYLIAIGFNG